MTTRRGRSLRGVGRGIFWSLAILIIHIKSSKNCWVLSKWEGVLYFAFSPPQGTSWQFLCFLLTWLLIVSALDLWRALSLRKSKSPVGQNRKKGLKNLLFISLPMNHPFCKWCQNIVYNHWSPLPTCSPAHRCPRVSPEIKNGACNRFS